MLESLIEIKNAEEKANDIVEKARASMKKMLEDADNRRADILSSTRTKTAEEIRVLKKKYGEEANMEAETITQDGEKELESIKKTSKVNFNNGVNAALSRVIE